MKAIAIRFGGLLFGLVVGAPWVAIGALPALLVLLIAPGRVEEMWELWMWPIGRAADWLTYGIAS